MNILYDSQIFSQQRYGGISRYFYELIQGLLPMESVFLHEGLHVNSYQLDVLTGYRKYWGCRVRDVRGGHRIRSFFNAMHLKWFTRDEDISIYHPTYYRDYSVERARKVVTVYDMIHELFPQQFIKDNTSIRKLKILKKADGIIAISESTKKDLVHLLGIPEEKIQVIYLANSLSKSIQGIPIVQGSYILYVGNRSGYKNFIGLAQAYAVSQYKNDVQLICFGGGDFSQEEQTILKNLGIQERVFQYSGDDTVLGNLYQYATAFVYPSLYEGFGLPVLEAMYYSTPVLTGKISSMPEVAGDAAEYFDPADPESIHESMDRLLSDSMRRKELTVQGREREKLFSWKKCAEETLKFYKSLL